MKDGNTAYKIKTDIRILLFKTVLIQLLLLFLLSGCGKNAYFEKFSTVEQENWDMNDIKEFNFRIDDISTSYNMIFIVRNTTDYPYSNLFLFTNMHLPDHTNVGDTIECLVADKYGYWLGKGFGKIRENRFLIKDSFRFADTGNYVLTLEQAMRDTLLSGITDVGLRIEKLSY